MGWIGGRLTRLALKIGTNDVAPKRGVVSDSAYPAAGDILLYEARGSESHRCHPRGSFYFLLPSLAAATNR